jgi:hypothetical protein
LLLLLLGARTADIRTLVGTLDADTAVSLSIRATTADFNAIPLAARELAPLFGQNLLGVLSFEGVGAIKETRTVTNSVWLTISSVTVTGTVMTTIAVTVTGTVMTTIAGSIMAMLFAKQTRLGCREGSNGSQYNNRNFEIHVFLIEMKELFLYQTV